MASNIQKNNKVRQRSTNNRSTNTHVTQRVGTYSNTDIKVDAVNTVIKEQLAPRIAQKNINAIDSDKRAFFYYKRKTMGRRCSCFLTETSPDSECRICYSTGFVGGYDKYGTITEIVDYTKPYLLAVNTRQNYDTRTIGFDGNSGSYIETDIAISKNAKGVDAYFLGADDSTKFKVEVISPSYKLITSGTDLEEFIPSGSVRLKISFLQKAYFQFLLIRFAILQDLIVYCDIANNSRAPSLENFGEFEALDEIPMTFAGQTMYIVNNKDLLYRLSDGAKLKIINHEKKIVANTLTEIQANARFLLSMDKVEKNLII